MIKYTRQHQENCRFQPQSRLGRTLASNLTWTVDGRGHRIKMTDQSGVVYDLDRQGRIIRMTDSQGRIFKLK
ncbi:MAG: RHS repeat protein [Alphaproteobacteria bacterium]|nr:RHS repeat protein [Alphaproteobacteria bacterium]